jgi:simple sugar transport system ATP-binding protein
VILITHNVYHAHEVADRIVILDRGQIVGEFRGDAVTTIELMEYMQSVAREGAPAA